MTSTRGARHGDGPLQRRLQQARTRTFVGREEEFLLLVDALHQRRALPTVLYVHGPGGIGKTTLLGQLAAAARFLGRAVVEVDAAAAGACSGAPAGRCLPLLAGPGTVLLVDSLEHAPPLEGWLRRHLLAHLAPGTLVAVAGRHPPAADWLVDPAWRDVLRVVPLGPLAPAEAEELLELLGVEPGRRAALTGFSGGSPLALALTAALAGTGGDGGALWAPPPPVRQALLSKLVGEVPTAAHRHALEVAAQAWVTTEDLLRSALPREGAAELFAWLRSQPYVEADGHGIVPHHAVREALAADLRWRDRQTHEAVRARLGVAALERVRSAAPEDAPRRAAEVLFLHRAEGRTSDFHSWEEHADLRDDPLLAADHAAVLRLAEAAEGPASADVARYWLGRHPQGFRVFRRHGAEEPVAFTALLHLEAPTAEDLAADPVVAAAWENLGAALGPGERLGITRFQVHPETYQLPSPVLDLVQRRSMAEVFRDARLACWVVVVADGDLWSPLLTRWRFGPLAVTAVGARAFSLFAHDWRTEPVERWLGLPVAEG
ncbi:ATP-binding protein [Kineococcus sp. NUM-3379]